MFENVLSTDNREIWSDPIFTFPTCLDIDTRKKKKKHKVISVIFHHLYTLYLFPFFVHKRQIWVVQVIAWVMAILGNEIFAETLCPWKLIHKNTGGMVETVKENSNGFSILLCWLFSHFFLFAAPFIWCSEYIFSCSKTLTQNKHVHNSTWWRFAKFIHLHHHETT